MRALRGPKASESDWGSAGGGRTVSVPDVAAGAVLGDIGNQFDEAATAAGVHPGSCSDNKGSEPERLAVFAAENGIWTAVGLERAEAAALIDITDPRAPECGRCSPCVGLGKAANWRWRIWSTSFRMERTMC